MSIVLKREARQFLETIKDDVDFVLIDGTLQIDDEKVCGCCGPPPSPDYKIHIVRKDNGSRPLITEKTVDLEKVVKFKVSKQLYNAIAAARLNIVIFYLESTNEQIASSILVAKFI